MKKLALVLFLSALVSNIALAQNVCINSTTGLGDLPACDSNDNMMVSLGSTSNGTAATFAAADATTSIGAAYASAVNLPDDTKVVLLDNQTNGDVWVSMDGGTSDTFHLTAGDIMKLDLAAFGLETTADVQLKDGTTASSTGTFYVYSFK